MPTFVLSGNNKKNSLDNKRGCKILKPSLTYFNTTYKRLLMQFDYFFSSCFVCLKESFQTHQLCAASHIHLKLYR